MRPPAGPVSQEALVRISRLAPDALIAQVVAVSPESGEAAITGIAVKSMAVGDAITFVNEDAQPLANGVIVRMAPEDTADVRYEAAPAGREPAVGDLAVRFAKARQAVPRGAF